MNDFQGLEGERNTECPPMIRGFLTGEMKIFWYYIVVMAAKYCETNGYVLYTEGKYCGTYILIQ